MNNSSLDSNKELQKYSQQLGFDPLSPAEPIETTDTPDPDIFDEDLQGSSDTQSRAKNPVLQYGAAALIGTLFVGLPLSAMLGIGGGKQVAKTTDPKEKTGQPVTPTTDPEVDKLKTNIALDIQAKQAAPPTNDPAQANAARTPQPESTPGASPTARSPQPEAKSVTPAAQAPAAKSAASAVTPVPAVTPIQKVTPAPTIARSPTVAPARSTITQPIPARTIPRSPDRRVENPLKSIQRYPSPQPANIAALPQTATRTSQSKPFGVQSQPIQRQASLPSRIASLPTTSKVQPQSDRSQVQRLPFGVQSQAIQRQIASLPSRIVSQPRTPKVQFRSLPNRIASLPTNASKAPTQRQATPQPVKIATLPTPPKTLAQPKPFQSVKPNGGVPIAANLRPQSAATLPTIAPLVPTTPAAPPMSYQEASALSIYGGDGDTPTPIVGSTKLKNNDLASASLAQNLSPALALPVGVVVSGRTITPYNSISKGNNTQQGSDVGVILDQPIQLAAGYSLPVGTIVQFGVTVADNGLVQATSKGVYINNSPIQVPAGAFALTAENSQALVAQQRAMRQDELASADTRTAIYGALGTVGQVLTQAGNQTVIGTTGLGTVSGIQTNNPTPNILAAAAQGAFQPLLTANQTRTAATSAQILGLSKINTLPVQTKVKVFVAAPGVIQIPLAGDRTTAQSSPQYRTAMEATDRVTQPIDPQITQPYSPIPQVPSTQPIGVRVPQAQSLQPYTPIPQVQPVQTLSPLQPTQPNNLPLPQIEPPLKDPDYSSNLNPQAGFSEAVTVRNSDSD
jgi:hypothetical protein